MSSFGVRGNGPSEHGSVGTSSLSETFTYDSNGNWLSATSNGTATSLSYNANSNQLIQFGSSPITLDAAGNTAADTNGARTFYYAAAGRLREINPGSTPAAVYWYNGLGQRISKTVPQGTIEYHYDIFGRLIGETTSTGQPTRDYVWVGGVPVAQIDHWVPQGNMLQLANTTVGPDGEIDWITYLHTDGLGTPRVGTDLAQNVVWRWDGEAFGQTAPNQSVPNGAFPVTVNLRYPGQYFDAESALVYNGARYYNPQTGRYITSDPTGLFAGLNTYAYVGGNPVSFTDPDGECPFCIVLIGAAVGGAAYLVGSWIAGAPVTAKGFLGGALEGAAVTLGALTGADIVWAGAATTIEAGSVAAEVTGAVTGLGLEAGIHSMEVAEVIAPGDGPAPVAGQETSPQTPQAVYP